MLLCIQTKKKIILPLPFHKPHTTCVAIDDVDRVSITPTYILPPQGGGKNMDCGWPVPACPELISGKPLLQLLPMPHALGFFRQDVSTAFRASLNSSILNGFDRNLLPVLYMKSRVSVLGSPVMNSIFPARAASISLTRL